jgi:hypothetical protein
MQNMNDGQSRAPIEAAVISQELDCLLMKKEISLHRVFSICGMSSASSRTRRPD